MSKVSIPQKVSLNPNATAPDGKMFGNKDPEKKYPFEKTWAAGIVVRQSHNVPGRDDLIDPKTVQFQVYEPDVFQGLIKNEGFIGWNVEIIHDPTK